LPADNQIADLPPLPLPPHALTPARIQARLARGTRPYVTLKAGTSLDGKIATAAGESQWITGEAARAHGHALRARHDGILVGINTVLADDPQLTVRMGQDGPAPVRIVLDSRCRIDPAARCLGDDGVRRIVICGAQAPAERQAALQRRGVEVLAFPDVQPAPPDYLARLRACGVDTLLVEGGAYVHAQIIAHVQADELFLYLSGIIIGGCDAPGWCGQMHVSALAQTPRLQISGSLMVGEDILVHGVFPDRP
jgi:diaminohydroxyphosphoribosylaminopyrimidine deaminase/5-amino-6-(5-phosphoribosylamino)uracil reductase